MQGLILYHGPSAIGSGDIVAIATLESRNQKTGNMVQVWILPADRDPLEALHAGKNSAACGSCPLQGTPNDAGKMVNRVCYVNIGQAPLAIYRAWKAGKYIPYVRSIHEPLLACREIRLGAYGDPAALPYKLVKYLANVGTGWTGYSHQLFTLPRGLANRLARWLMASCHNKAQHAEAIRRGWRAFTVIREGQEAPANAVACPHYTHNVSCADCQLCCGTSKQAKSVYVIAHAKVGLNLQFVPEIIK